MLVMLKTESVPGSIGYFIETICPEMSDPLDCEIKVGEWWSYLSQIAFNDQASKYFCYFMDPDCQLFLNESWDCDDCQNDVISFAMGYGSEGSVNTIVKALQGIFICSESLFVSTFNCI